MHIAKLHQPWRYAVFMIASLPFNQINCTLAAVAFAERKTTIVVVRSANKTDCGLHIAKLHQPWRYSIFMIASLLFNQINCTLAAVSFAERKATMGTRDTETLRAVASP